METKAELGFISFFRTHDLTPRLCLLALVRLPVNKKANSFRAALTSRCNDPQHIDLLRGLVISYLKDGTCQMRSCYTVFEVRQVRSKIKNASFAGARDVVECGG